MDVSCFPFWADISCTLQDSFCCSLEPQCVQSSLDCYKMLERFVIGRLTLPKPSALPELDHSLEYDCIIKAFMAHHSELINLCMPRHWSPLANERRPHLPCSHVNLLHDNQQEHRLIAGEQEHKPHTDGVIHLMRNSHILQLYQRKRLEKRWKYAGCRVLIVPRNLITSLSLSRVYKMFLVLS